MIDKIGFDAEVPRRTKGDEPFRECRLVTQESTHRVLLDDEHARECRRGRRPDPNGLTGEGAFPKKSPGPNIATTASLPVRDSTEILIPPF